MSWSAVVPISTRLQLPTDSVPAGASGSQRAPSYHWTAPLPRKSTWKTTVLAVDVVVVPVRSTMNPFGAAAGSTAKLRSAPAAAVRAQLRTGNEEVESSASNSEWLPWWAMSALTVSAARPLGVVQPAGTLPTASDS